MVSLESPLSKNHFGFIHQFPLSRSLHLPLRHHMSIGEAKGFRSSLQWALHLPEGRMWRPPIWHASCHLAATWAATHGPCHAPPIQCCRLQVPVAISWLLPLVSSLVADAGVGTTLRAKHLLLPVWRRLRLFSKGKCKNNCHACIWRLWTVTSLFLPLIWPLSLTFCSNMKCFYGTPVAHHPDSHFWVDFVWVYLWICTRTDLFCL